MATLEDKSDELQEVIDAFVADVRAANELVAEHMEQLGKDVTKKDKPKKEKKSKKKEGKKAQKSTPKPSKKKASPKKKK